MELILLGAGTAVPAPDRSPAGALLAWGDRRALIDLGPGALGRAAAHGLDPLALEDVFLTHLHSDHTLDLVTLLQVNDSWPGRTRLAPLRLTGPVGTATFYARLMAAYPGVAPATYPLHIREMTAGDGFMLDGVTVSAARSGHTPESLAFRFDAAGGSLVVTGDCAYSPALAAFCSDADLLVCECSFPAGWDPGSHMNADDVGRLADEAGVGRLVVTHLYPPALEAADLPGQIRARYPGPLEIARDGLTLTLP